MAAPARSPEMGCRGTREGIAAVQGDSRMRIENGGPHIGHGCLVLFPFDDHSLPYQNGVELKLHGHTAPCGTTPRVLEPGDPGDPDSLRAIYYGSVHRVGAQLYMWYLGQDHDPG